MSAVEHRHREQVDQAEIDRQHRHEPEQRHNAALGNLTRQLGNAQRPAQLVGGAGADHHLPHRLERGGRQVPRLADRAYDGARRIALDVFGAAAANAELTDLAAPKPIALLDQARPDPQVNQRPVAPDDHRHRHARIEPHDLLDVLEPIDRPTVDADDRVARADPAGFGGAARHDLADLRRGVRLAIGHEQQREHDDGEDEIRKRPTGDDGGPLAQPLARKGDVALGRAQFAEPRDRQPGTGIAVAEHLDVPAERDRAELPARAGAVPPAEQLGTKSDREHLDLYPIAPGDQVMAELVDEHENSEDHQKHDDVKESAVQKRY